MSLNNPITCEIGKTYFYAPNFQEADFAVNVNGNFSDPLVLSFVGTGTFADYVVRTPIPVAGLNVTATFNITDSGNANVLGSLWINGGIGLVRSVQSTDPSVSSPAGAWFVPHGNSGPQYVINNYISTLFQSDALESNIEYAVSITLSVTDTASYTDGGHDYYSLTIRLQIPGVGLDHTETIDAWQESTYSNVHLFIAGPISSGDSYMDVTALYLTGTGFPHTCYGDVPTGSSILPASTGKISHAGIYLQTGSAALANSLHNEFKDSV